MELYVVVLSLMIMIYNYLYTSDDNNDGTNSKKYDNDLTIVVWISTTMVRRIRITTMIILIAW